MSEKVRLLKLARDILEKQNIAVGTNVDDEALTALAQAISSSEGSMFSSATFIYRCVTAAYRLGWERGFQYGRGE